MSTLLNLHTDMNYFNERRGIKKKRHGIVKKSCTWSDWAYEPLEADYIIKNSKTKTVFIFYGACCCWCLMYEQLNWDSYYVMPV